MRKNEHTREIDRMNSKEILQCDNISVITFVKFNR
jgi:hypothetical protein